MLSVSNKRSYLYASWDCNVTKENSKYNNYISQEWKGLIFGQYNAKIEKNDQLYR